jgi:hypothetical protein
MQRILPFENNDEIHVFTEDFMRNFSSYIVILKDVYFMEYIVGVCVGKHQVFVEELEKFIYWCMMETCDFLGKQHLNSLNIPLLYSHFLIESRRESGFFYELTNRFLSASKCGFCDICKDPLKSTALHCSGRRAYFFGKSVNDSVISFFCEYMSVYVSILTFVLFYHPLSHEMMSNSFLPSILPNLSIIKRMDSVRFLFRDFMKFHETNVETLDYTKRPFYVPCLFQPILYQNPENPYVNTRELSPFFYEDVFKPSPEKYFPNVKDPSKISILYERFLRIFYYYRSSFGYRTDCSYDLTRCLLEKIIGSCHSLCQENHLKYFRPLIPGMEDLVKKPFCVIEDKL